MPFIESLQLKLVQQKKAEEFFQTAAAARSKGKQENSRSPLRRSIAKKPISGSASKVGSPGATVDDSSRRSAAFSDMLGPVLGPHGYSQEQIQDLVKEYEQDV